MNHETHERIEIHETSVLERFVVVNIVVFVNFVVKGSDAQAH